MTTDRVKGTPSRRELLLWGGGSAAVTALWPCLSACDAPPRQTPAACLDPLTEEQRTLAAFVDAVVPGYESDPGRAPGAIDACGLNALLDPFSPVEGLLEVATEALDGTARALFGRPLFELALAEREEVVAATEEELPRLTLVIRFARTSFYASLYDDLAERWLGVLAPSLGYVEQGFGFAEPQSEEMTDDGNLP